MTKICCRTGGPGMTGHRGNVIIITTDQGGHPAEDPPAEDPQTACVQTCLASEVGGTQM